MEIRHPESEESHKYLESPEERDDCLAPRPDDIEAPEGVHDLEVADEELDVPGHALDLRGPLRMVREEHERLRPEREDAPQYSHREHGSGECPSFQCLPQSRSEGEGGDGDDGIKFQSAARSPQDRGPHESSPEEGEGADGGDGDGDEVVADEWDAPEKEHRNTVENERFKPYP